ncbi:hypothetical protein NQ318_000694 [Aromia moschata]|uniref:Transposase n=1 Tax=Aromia moschata TaxID=1265417 RepID=A0AAV8X7T0_9CUCU|nr:hypothetical protein NQ318_000694 [Aromia moschata]
MEFCERVMDKANNDENVIRNIVFTDESTFALHGRHNPSVGRYWSRENLHSFLLRTQYSQKLNVWGDGCPAHNGIAVREFLNANFPNRLLSGQGTILWPARACHWPSLAISSVLRDTEGDPMFYNSLKDSLQLAADEPLFKELTKEVTCDVQVHLRLEHHHHNYRTP